MTLPGRLLSIAALVAATLCAHAADGYRVVRAYPHDQRAFTQGLVYVDGHLYESTGLEGKSSLRMVNLESGRILQFHEVPGKFFAEGLTEWRGKLIQLTWQNRIGFVYDRFTFRQLRTFPIPCDGWGLTQNGKNLILSDGTEYPEKGRVETIAGLINPETGAATFRATFPNPLALIRSGGSGVAAGPSVVVIVSSLGAVLPSG